LVTRIIRWTGPPAVVRVETSSEVIVALPGELPPHQALGLARLVLNSREYAELSRKIKPRRPRTKPHGSSPHQERHSS